MVMYKCLRVCCSPLPQRFVVATAVLVCFSITFMQRTCFNLAITEMAFRLNVPTEEKLEVCEAGNNSSEKSSTDNEVAEFHWSTEDQARLLSIFYVGYIITHLPGGILSDKYGPKKILGSTMIVSGVCTLLTPMCARFNIYVLVIVRFFLGLSQGPLFPAQSTFVARWSFQNERDMMNAYMNIGAIIGAVAGQLGTGYLIHLLRRWDIVFYTFGWLTVPACLFWFVFAYDSVESHPFMGEKERRKLSVALESEVMKNVDLQYGKILKSLPVWAMVIGGFGHDWAFFIIINVLPQYMSYVLLFNVHENGLLLCLPHLCMLAVSMITPCISRQIVNRGLMSKTTQCKVFFTICNQGAVFCFLAASFAGCNRLVVVVLFSSAMGVLGMIYSCVRVVQVDLAPNMAGFLMAIMNGIGGLGGFFVPELFARFQTSNTVEGWRNGFFFSATVITVTTVVFLIWGSSDVQDWNFPKRNQEQEEGREERREENEESPGKQTEDK